MKQGRVVIITVRELYTNNLSDIKMNEMYLVIRTLFVLQEYHFLRTKK